MYRKIDIYVRRNYVCSTNQARDLKEAKEKFLKNPKYMGAKGITTIADIASYEVACKWSDEK